MRHWHAICVAVLLCSPVSAEVVFHGSGELRNGNMTVVPGDGVFDGMTVEESTNLLHSFRVFNVNGGETLEFTAPGNIQNIISRVAGDRSDVTGLQSSALNGSITSPATLYVINPFGVVIGAGAAINVNGSFYASSASELHLADGTIIPADANLDGASVLTAAAPSAFGFATNPGSVNIEGATLLSDLFNNFNLPDGESFNLVGGDVAVNGGSFVQGVKNQINLVSVASAGIAPIDDDGVHVESFEKLGRVEVSEGSFVDAQSIVVRGGDLVIDNALVSPGGVNFLLGGAASTSPDGGSVDIDVRDSFTISGTGETIVAGISPGIYVFTNPSFDRANASISIKAGQLVMEGFAQIKSERFSTGLAGGIDIEADLVHLSDGASISSVNSAPGTGANVEIDAAEVMLEGNGGIKFTGIAAQSMDTTVGFTFFAPNLDAGNVKLSASERLVISHGAEITTDSFAFGAGGDIDLTFGDAILSKDGASSGGILAQSVIAGDAGNITVTGDTLTILDGFQISATTAGVGDAGTISVDIKDTITISGLNSGLFSTAFDVRQEDLDAFGQSLGAPDFAGLGFTSFEQALAFFGIENSPGNGGSIVVETDQLVMSDDTRIDTSTFGAGDAGSILATVGTAELLDGAQIRSRSGGVDRDTDEVVVGTGNGGIVELNAAGSVTVAGMSAAGAGSALSTSTLGSGSAGDLSVTAGQIHVSDGGNLLSESLGTGQAGNIDLHFDQATFSADGTDGGILASSAVAGDAGDITLSGTKVTVRDGFQISATTSGVGDAGTVTLDIEEKITLSGKDSGIFSTAFDVQPEDLDFFGRSLGADDFAGLGFASFEDALAFFGIDSTPGNGGTVMVETDRLIMNDGSRIDTSTFGDGNAGAILVSVGSAELTGGAQIRSRSGGIPRNSTETLVGAGDGGTIELNATRDILVSDTNTSLSTSTIGSGDAGNLLLTARQLQLFNGGALLSESLGTGLAGDITVETREQILIRGGSSVSTRAEVSDGGNITLNTTELLDLLDSQITTSVESGEGAGGNINIDPEFVVLQNSQIIANAFGGPGGNIRIVAGVFIADHNSVVKASSERNVDGTVEIVSPDTDLSSEVVVMPDSYLDASALLRARCGAARAGAASSLTSSGRGGLPPDPDDYLASDGVRDAYGIDTSKLSSRSTPARQSESVGLLAMASGFECELSGR